MAAPSFRDRLLTRRGAKAIMSPAAIAAGVALAVLAVVVGLPVWTALPVGVATWALVAWRLLPRAPRAERIDPFTLQEPWRRFVQDALQARNRFLDAVERAPAGPLRDRLQEIADRVQTGVDECWLIARRGHALVKARRGIDVAAVDRQLDRLTTGDEAGEPSLSALTRSLEVQRSTADRLDGVIDSAERELRLLDARLDEAVARTLELSATAGDSAVTGLSADVDQLVSEMESLRLAMDETNAAAQGGAGGGGPAGGAQPGELPPGGPP
jgi:hypothetical protein